MSGGFQLVSPLSGCQKKEPLPLRDSTAAHPGCSLPVSAERPRSPCGTLNQRVTNSIHSFKDVCRTKPCRNVHCMATIDGTLGKIYVVQKCRNEYIQRIQLTFLIDPLWVVSVTPLSRLRVGEMALYLSGSGKAVCTTHIAGIDFVFLDTQPLQTFMSPYHAITTAAAVACLEKYPTSTALYYATVLPKVALQAPIRRRPTTSAKAV